jgi:hypothetical protein
VRPPVLAVLAAAALLGAGCGNERGTPPPLDALGKPGATKEYANPGIVSFRYPDSWFAAGATPPRYAQLSSGGALASVYAYPRDDLATDPASLEAARRRLVQSLHRREPGFLVERTRITEVDGSPAVEILGRGRIAGEPVKIRSVHVYRPGVEWLVDAYARPPQFAEANRTAFAPMLASLRLGEKPPPAAGEG